MIEIPPEVLNALWALIIIVLGWLAAVVQTYGKGKAEDKTEAATVEATAAKEETKAVIDYFDPTVKTVTTPPDIIPERTYKMSDATKRWITYSESDADKVAILEQVSKAEEAGQATYRVTYSKGYYDIEYGLVKDSARDAK